MNRTALILGGGIVGIATGIALQDHGWNVTVLDRKAPGRETSFGNAGILQREAVAPYAMPLSPGAWLNVLLGRGNDVNARLSEIARQGVALARYTYHSMPMRHARLSAAYEMLIRRSLDSHQKLITASGAEALIRRTGYREYYRDPAGLEAASRRADALQAHGLLSSVLDATALQAAEPGIVNPGAGALHWLDPWSVSDPGLLVRHYGEHFGARGGSVVTAGVSDIREHGVGYTVVSDTGQWQTRHLVISAGPWSPDLLALLGIRVPMIYKRGYHRHHAAPKGLIVPMLDTDFGYVLAPMSSGLRITTGAHLARLDAASDDIQLTRAERAAASILDIGAAETTPAWRGTRPCLPDMVPLIGESSRHTGLWVNFGHGHQGLTLGPASGQLLAQLMSGEPTAVDAKPFSPLRYKF